LLFLAVFLWVYAAAMPSAWPVMMHTWPLAAAGVLLYVIAMSQPSTKGENRFGKPEQPWC